MTRPGFNAGRNVYIGRQYNMYRYIDTPLAMLICSHYYCSSRSGTVQLSINFVNCDSRIVLIVRQTGG